MKGTSRLFKIEVLFFFFFLFNFSMLVAFDVPDMDTQNTPVDVNGDYLEYRTKATQVVTKGHAFITFKDMKIKADTIQSNTKTEDLFAYGHVEFWKGYDQTTGDFLVYNMKTGKGWMRNATVQKNRNFFKAREVFLSPAFSLAEDIMQTSCDHFDHPHFRIMASKIETVPGYYMTMEGLMARWGGKKIYSRGYEKSSLVEKEKFLNTQQGMSQIDGFYLKFHTDLAVREDMKGVFNYDYYSKRGYGFGFNGTYGASGGNGGNFSFYDLQETLRGHSNLQMNLSYNQRFKNGDALTTNFAYTGDKMGTDPEKQDLNTQLNLTTKVRSISTNIAASKYFDLAKGDKNTGYQILNRVPEVNFTLPPYTIPFIKAGANITGMFGRYEEGTPSDLKETTKKDVRSSFTIPPLKLGTRFDMTPSYNFEKNWYSAGEIRETGTTMVRAAHKFSKTTNFEFDYNITTQKGQSPFKFDATTMTDVFSTRLRVAEGPWSLNPINFNYNRVSGRLEQVYIDYSLRSQQTAFHNWEFFLRRDYVPDQVPFSQMALTRLTPGDTNARYRFSSNFWSFDTSLTYPHQYSRITNTSFNYRTTIRPQWEITSNGNYNNLTGKFGPLNLGIVRDLHCWEAKAQYNYDRKEFWVEFYMKAYPDDSGRFRYGADTHKLEAKLAEFDQMTQRLEQYQNHTP
ncbi:MAG: LPS-assembly protein LptD [Candidatus Riflebacteria bacterium]|nr:LPS-assembly protein LptD [Candidatus Riflebacteria bacterium]